MKKSLQAVLMISILVELGGAGRTPERTLSELNSIFWTIKVCKLNPEEGEGVRRVGERASVEGRERLIFLRHLLCASTQSTLCVHVCCEG